MDIVRKRFVDWSVDTKRRLKHATLPDGVMREFMVAFPDSPTIVMFDNTQVMGWAFILLVGHTGHPFVSVYVNRRFRKSGVATCLIKETIQDYDCISLATWNPKTRRLFGRLRDEHLGSIITFNWPEGVHVYRQMVEDAMFS
jgi:hypothetical protein